MPPIDENTSGREEARKVLRESQRSSRRADILIAATRQSVGQVREAREANHFADKFRAIIKGIA